MDFNVAIEELNDNMFKLLNTPVVLEGKGFAFALCRLPVISLIRLSLELLIMLLEIFSTPQCRQNRASSPTVEMTR